MLRTHGWPVRTSVVSRSQDGYETERGVQVARAPIKGDTLQWARAVSRLDREVLLRLPDRERVKVIFSFSHQRSRCQLMNSLPLSESIPMMGNDRI